jgi:endonuclease G, mitochondrial
MDLDPMTMAYARLAQRAALRTHLGDPNVSMIDIGQRRRNGELEDELTIRFHVRRKLSLLQLQAAADQGYTRPVPREIAAGAVAFKTDVVQGDYRTEGLGWWNRPKPARNGHAGRTDPLCGGISISDPFHNTYGTLGGRVHDRATGQPMILSNFHVLAVEWTARAGQRIYQPGRMDGGAPADTVATLVRHAMAFNLDAAVATLLPNSRPLINHQLGLGPVSGVARPQIGRRVVKSGARTEVTYGLVTGVEGVVGPLRYGNLKRSIAHVLTIEPQQSEDLVSAGGDSGSWWLDQATMQAVGLHFAGQFAPDTALAIDMAIILDALNVDIDVGRPSQAPARRRIAPVATRMAALEREAVPA